MPGLFILQLQAVESPGQSCPGCRKPRFPALLFVPVNLLLGDLHGHHDPLLPTSYLENSSLFRVP